MAIRARVGHVSTLQELHSREGGGGDGGAAFAKLEEIWAAHGEDESWREALVAFVCDCGSRALSKIEALRVLFR